MYCPLVQVALHAVQVALLVVVVPSQPEPSWYSPRLQPPFTEHSLQAAPVPLPPLSSPAPLQTEVSMYLPVAHAVQEEQAARLLVVLPEQPLRSWYCPGEQLMVHGAHAAWVPLPPLSPYPLPEHTEGWMYSPAGQAEHVEQELTASDVPVPEQTLMSFH